METQAISGKQVVIGATLLEKELAEVLGMPLGTVKRLRSEGKIPYVRIGRGRVIYIAESILHWLRSKEVWESCGTSANNTLGSVLELSSGV